MSWQVKYWVVCDGCGETGFPSDNKRSVWTLAKKFGWARVHYDHYCPACKTKPENQNDRGGNHD